MFAPVFDCHMFDEDTGHIRKIVLTHGKPKGRKHEMDDVASLGLVLYWYCTCGSSVARSTSIAFFIWFNRNSNVQMAEVLLTHSLVYSTASSSSYGKNTISCGTYQIYLGHLFKV